MAEWIDLSERKGKRHGMGNYQKIFKLHFYWNIAIALRYKKRMRGNVQLLEQAFCAFMHLSEIRKLRTLINRRLKAASADNVD